MANDIQYIDDIVEAAFAGRMQTIFWEKSSAASTQLNRVSTLWTGTGIPGAGVYGSVGNANGRVCTRATTGSIQFVTASAGRQLYLTLFSLVGISSTNVIGYATLADRIADCVILHSASSGAITGLDATSRLGSVSGSGDGCQIFIETQSALSAIANSFTLTYTNQNGISGRVTPVFTTVSSSQLATNAIATQYVQLQTGDLSVRSIESITHINGTGTGQLAICLIKPLSEIVVPTPGVYFERDMVADLQFAPKVHNSASLMVLFGGTNTGAVENCIGLLTLVEV